MHRILLIDDDTATVRWMYRALSEQGYDVRTAVSAAQALDCALEFQPELLCTDWFLQDGIDGVELARRLKELSPELKVVIITGLSKQDLTSVVGREELPVEAILEKPIDVPLLLETVESALC
jgi:two-component system, response regulator, stage 0 sporulation protein F